jgi:hypothetical protein
MQFAQTTTEQIKADKMRHESEGTPGTFCRLQGRKSFLVWYPIDFATDKFDEFESRPCPLDSPFRVPIKEGHMRREKRDDALLGFLLIQRLKEYKGTGFMGGFIRFKLE